MFARSVSFHLKPNSVGQLTQIIEQDVLPLLRKQKGFQDEITLVTPGGAMFLQSVCGTNRKTRTRIAAMLIQDC